MGHRRGLRGEAKSEYLLIMVSRMNSLRIFHVLEAGKMGKHKDLSNFNKGQIVMARQLGLSISKTKVLVGCSH